MRLNELNFNPFYFFMNISGKFKGSGQEDIVTLTFESMAEFDHQLH